MKQFGLALSLVALALAGCNSAPGTSSTAAPADTVRIQAAAPSQTLHFVGPMDLTIQLQTRDNFDTAVMSDNADRSFQMKAVPAASGIRMTDGKNTSIHFKNDEGVVEFVPGKPISVKEFKQ